MKFTKHVIYISLFAILYLIVAFSSFWHACSFFGLANTSWMSIILAFAFEVGQAAVLFSLLTSEKDRGRIMPWVLMTMFTLVQVIGNVFSSYKYIITNSVENLRYFKEPIFIWTSLPDDQATVIVTYVVGAILPVAALLLTSMITNYLTDQEEEKNETTILVPQITSEKGPENPPIELKNREDFLNVYGDNDEQDGHPENEESEKVKEPENDKEMLKTQETPQEEYKKEKLDEGVINNEETPKESIKGEPVDEDDSENKNLLELDINKKIDDLSKENKETLRDDQSDDTVQQKNEKIEQSGDKENNDVSKNIKEHQLDNSSEEPEIEYNNETDEENTEVDDKNLKMAAALIGGNVPNKQRVNKESHFINN